MTVLLVALGVDVLPHSAPLTLLPLHERWRDLRLLCRLGGTRRLGGCAITPEERTFANIRTDAGFTLRREAGWQAGWGGEVWVTRDGVWQDFGYLARAPTLSGGGRPEESRTAALQPSCQALGGTA